jgi:hypothetical protein
MAVLSKRRAAVVPEGQGLPRLELSGPRLTAALEGLAAGAESTGGIERFVAALSAKCALFERVFAWEGAGGLTEASFLDACAFIAPARRHVGEWLGVHGFAAMREALLSLLRADAPGEDPLAAFAARFPDDRRHRWVRDLGAEVLHFTAPERYPLMTRWIWDARTRTGVLREIWHDDAGDAGGRLEDVGDGIAAHLSLRQELAVFLKDQGVYRDVPLVADLLCAQVYGEYIRAQGSAFLRADFNGGDDIVFHVRRLLGLDALRGDGRRTRVKLAGGRAHLFSETLAADHAPPG